MLKTLSEMALEVLAQNSTEGLDGKWNFSVLNKKKSDVNKWPDIFRKKIFNKLLSNPALSENIRLNCVYIFINDKTKKFSFKQQPMQDGTPANIIQLLLDLSWKIEKIDLSQFIIDYGNKDAFERLINKNSYLKSVQVACDTYHRSCLIYRLLLTSDECEDEIKEALKKIDYINIINDIKREDCAHLLKFLPNLKGLGKLNQIGTVLKLLYDDPCEFQDKILNLTEIYDSYTHSGSIENFAMICPKIKFICIKFPGNGVVEKLHLFPLLEKIHLKTRPKIKPEISYNLLKRLPNLRSLGKYCYLGEAINMFCNETYSYKSRKLNLKKIYDRDTNLSTLKNFANICPKLKMISLKLPGKNVMENLKLFPLLEEIRLKFFEHTELIAFLKTNGWKIRKLQLDNDYFFNKWHPSYKTTFVRLCPNLVQLKVGPMVFL